jgi:hypothetical protein
MAYLIGKESSFMGVSLNQFLTGLYWIVAVLAIGFIAIFIIRWVEDAKNTLTQYRKRVIR